MASDTTGAGSWRVSTDSSSIKAPLVEDNNRSTRSFWPVDSVVSRSRARSASSWLRSFDTASWLAVSWPAGRGISRSQSWIRDTPSRSTSVDPMCGMRPPPSFAMRYSSTERKGSPGAMTCAAVDAEGALRGPDADHVRLVERQVVVHFR